MRYANDSSCVFKVYGNSTTIVNSDRYRDTKITNKQTISLQLTGTFFNTSQAKDITFELQSYIDNELAIINSKIQTYKATDIQNNYTDLIGTFTDVPSGRYRISLYMGDVFGFALFASGRLVNITLENLQKVGTADSSYAGGGVLSLSGLGFPVLDNWQDSISARKNRIKVCGSVCSVNSVTLNSLQCSIPPLVTASIQNKYNLLQPDIIMPFLISSDMKSPTIEQRLIDGLFSTVYTSINMYIYV